MIKALRTLRFALISFLLSLTFAATASVGSEINNFTLEQTIASTPTRSVTSLLVALRVSDLKQCGGNEACIAEWARTSRTAIRNAALAPIRAELKLLGDPLNRDVVQPIDNDILACSNPFRCARLCGGFCRFVGDTTYDSCAAQYDALPADLQGPALQNCAIRATATVLACTGVCLGE
jgi:hypothetical protein